VFAVTIEFGNSEDEEIYCAGGLQSTLSIREVYDKDCWGMQGGLRGPQ
jgi:hypothetical protein